MLKTCIENHILTPHTKDCNKHNLLQEIWYAIYTPNHFLQFIKLCK